jgi:hypothetical protein
MALRSTGYTVPVTALNSADSLKFVITEPRSRRRLERSGSQ